MKRFFILLAVVSLPLISFAQSSNCSELVFFSPKGHGGSSRASIKSPEVNLQVLNVEFSYVLISLSLTDKSNCFEAGRPVTITFTDGSEVSLPNDNDVACSTEGLINIGGHHKHTGDLDQLRQKLVKSIRIDSSKGSIESFFTEENQVLFRDVMNCIAEKL